MAGANEATVKINGHVYSWANVVIKIEGRPFEGIQSLTYSDKRERQKVTGNNGGGPPLGMTEGLYNAEDGKIEAIRETIEDIRQYLALLSASTSFGDTRFMITATLSKLGKPSITDRIHGCRVIGAGSDHQNSADPLKPELPFTCEKINHNGLSLFSQRIF